MALAKGFLDLFPKVVKFGEEEILQEGIEAILVCILRLFVNLFSDFIKGPNLLFFDVDAALQDAFKQLDHDFLPKFTFHP